MLSNAVGSSCTHIQVQQLSAHEVSTTSAHTHHTFLSMPSILAVGYRGESLVSRTVGQHQNMQHYCGFNNRATLRYHRPGQDVFVGNLTVWCAALARTATFVCFVLLYHMSMRQPYRVLLWWLVNKRLMNVVAMVTQM